VLASMPLREMTQCSLGEGVELCAAGTNDPAEEEAPK